MPTGEHDFNETARQAAELCRTRSDAWKGYEQARTFLDMTKSVAGVMEPLQRVVDQAAEITAQHEAMIAAAQKVSEASSIKLAPFLQNVGQLGNLQLPSFTIKAMEDWSRHMANSVLPMAEGLSKAAVGNYPYDMANVVSLIEGPILKLAQLDAAKFQQMSEMVDFNLSSKTIEQFRNVVFSVPAPAEMTVRLSDTVHFEPSREVLDSLDADAETLASELDEAEADLEALAASKGVQEIWRSLSRVEKLGSLVAIWVALMTINWLILACIQQSSLDPVVFLVNGWHDLLAGVFGVVVCQAASDKDE